MLVEGISKMLKAAATITALVGTPATRKDNSPGIFPVQSPEQTPTPFVVYSQISGDGNPSLDGANALHQCRLSFSCYGSTYLDAKKLQRAIRQLFEGYSGELPDGTPAENFVLVLETDAFEDGPFLFNAPIDFQVVYVDLPISS